jgi:hypothetical protein
LFLLKKQKGVVYDGPPELLVEERKIIGKVRVLFVVVVVVVEIKFCLFLTKQGLSLARFKQYVPMIEEEARCYFERHWGDSGEADLHKTFNEVTFQLFFLFFFVNPPKNRSLC